MTANKLTYLEWMINVKNNRGITLIELIIVMTIVGIIAIGSVTGYRMLNAGGAQSTVERIDAMLDYVQLENMTKKEPYYLIIEKRNGDYQLSVERGTERILSEKLELKEGGEITFQYGEDPTQYLVSDVAVAGRNIKEKLEICFSKNSGSFIPNRAPDQKIVSRIGVSASSTGRSYSIALVEITGKHYISR